MMHYTYCLSIYSQDYKRKNGKETYGVNFVLSFFVISFWKR